MASAKNTGYAGSADSPVRKIAAAAPGGPAPAPGLPSAVPPAPPAGMPDVGMPGAPEGSTGMPPTGQGGPPTPEAMAQAASQPVVHRPRGGY